MLYPTINDLTKGNFNRYELSLATARCARIVTDEYTKLKEDAEKNQTGSKDSDKRPIYSMIDNKELCDEKAVKTAIRRIHDGEYNIVRRPEGYVPVKAVEEPTEEEPIDLKSMFAEEEDGDEELEGEEI